MCPAPRGDIPSPDTLDGPDASFGWPMMGRVVGFFGESKLDGIDIEAIEGTVVRAVGDALVIYVGSGVEGYGNLVILRHPNGYVSAYGHLRDIAVGKGDTVARGDPIGSAGTTGRAGRPQLHFQLRRGATPVDPLPLLAGGYDLATDPGSVARIQTGLQSLGFLHGRADGVAGEATARAIRNFQVYFNYEVTGTIGPELPAQLWEDGAEF